MLIRNQASPTKRLQASGGARLALLEYMGKGVLALDPPYELAETAREREE